MPWAKQMRPLKISLKAISIDLLQAPSYFNRGMIFAELQQKQAARADLEQFIALSDNSEWTELAKSMLMELDE